MTWRCVFWEYFDKIVFSSMSDSHSIRALFCSSVVSELSLKSGSESELHATVPIAKTIRSVDNKTLFFIRKDFKVVVANILLMCEFCK